MKTIIIEGNSNDKDNTRNYFVKGERGYSAYELYVQNGGTLTEEQWLDEFLNADNYYNKSEVKGLVIDNLTSSTTDQPLSANQGKNLKTLVDNTYTKTQADNLLGEKIDFGNIKIITGTITTSGTLTTTTINYPNGCTKDNCIPISIGSKKSTDDEYTYLSTGLTDTLAYIYGSFRGIVIFKSENIEIKTYTYNENEIITDYKLVLLKIS